MSERNLALGKWDANTRRAAGSISHRSAGSIALVAFGLDSAIEGVASIVIIWRFTGSRMFSERAERRAQVLVAVQFFVLAPFVAYEAKSDLGYSGSTLYAQTRTISRNDRSKSDRWEIFTGALRRLSLGSWSSSARAL